MSQPVGPALPDKKSPCVFFKLIVSSILQDKKLKLPHKFVKKYGDELSPIATLATPSGHLWPVELKKDQRRMWFDIGLNAFLEYYSICIGHFLVFRYEGNSHFNVHVYDLTASEINYIPNGLNNSERSGPDGHVKNIQDGDLAKIMVSCPKCSSSYLLTNKDSDEGGPHILNETQQITKTIKQESESSKLLELENFVYRVFLIDFTHPNSLKDMYEHESLFQVEVKEEWPAMNSPRNITRRWGAVTEEEKLSAYLAATTFKPDNPFCRIVLRPSYVYRGILLHMPRWFARKHLNGVNGSITLQVSEGKKWTVRCVHVDGDLKFCKGWANFVLDNNLDEGDVCVFELINTKEIVLKVTIFRVLAE